MKVYFEIIQPKKETSTIRLLIQYGAFKINKGGKKVYAPYRRTLPWLIPTQLWDKTKKRLTKSKDHPEAEIINVSLDHIENQLKQYEVECNFRGDPLTAEGLEETIDNVVAPKQKTEIKHFAEAIAQMIEESETGVRLKEDGSQFTEGTIRTYKNALWHLENFEEWRNRPVLLSDLNKELGDQLKEFFNVENHSHNTKAKIIRKLITAYNYAKAKGWAEETDFPKTRITEIQTDAIALSMEEVNAIFQLNLSGDPEMDMARDLLITGIWTLMRFSDYSSIEDYNIKDGIVKSNTQKTGVQVHIPIHWQLQKIIDKYDGKLLHLSSLAMFNRQVKEVAKKAGITQLEEIRIDKGGQKSKKIVPRYTLVSSHTARRTGATLLYLDEIPKKQIMLLTGHKKEDSFDRYIRIGSYANAKILADRAIFKETEKKATRASDLEDGYYCVKVNETAFVAMFEQGTIYQFKEEPRTIDAFLNQGGKVLFKVQVPN